MSPNHGELVATEWRGQLQEKIRKILARGGPRSQGETIFVKAALSEAEVEEFAAVAGQLNDLPFGEALAGTLEVRPPARWEDGTAQLVFVFRPAPPKQFGSSKGLMQARGAAGEYPLVILGVDFNALPGIVFSTDRSELKAIEKGSRHEAVVPIPRGVSIAPGDRVVFVEATADPFGTPNFVPGGKAVAVALTEVKDEEYPWAGRRLYRIAWDPKQVSVLPTGETSHGKRDRAKLKEG